jgi:hypothetical protein
VKYNYSILIVYKDHAITIAYYEHASALTMQHVFQSGTTSWCEITGDRFGLEIGELEVTILTDRI